VVLNYRVNPGAVGELIETIGLDYENVVIDPAIQESVKAATAEFNAEQLITLRPQVSQSIEDVLVARLETRGIEVQEVSITEFGFQEEFSRAIEQKQVAEQDALRAERELQRARIEAQQQVARAEAEAASRRAVAEADADALLVVAQAEAEALRIQSEFVTPPLLQLRFIENWDGVLPRIMSGEGSLGTLISLPADDVLSSPPPQAGNAPPTPTPSPEPTPEPDAEGEAGEATAEPDVQEEAVPTATPAQ
jgi:regulator of protease activity HflC (stomatin/prohibitin superfamily)